MTVNLAIGQVTPPAGINIVAASGISGISIRKISRSAMPFISGGMRCAPFCYIYSRSVIVFPEFIKFKKNAAFVKKYIA